jgi:hypothetical protein
LSEVDGHLGVAGVDGHDDGAVLTALDEPGIDISKLHVRRKLFS